MALHGISLTFAKGSAADEQDFLGEIERRYETPITRIPVTEYRYLDNADAVVRQFETPGVLVQVQDQIWEAARRAGCRVLLSGFFGDQMLAGRGYLVDLARRGRWLKIRRDLREFGAWMTDAAPVCSSAIAGAAWFAGCRLGGCFDWSSDASRRHARRRGIRRGSRPRSDGARWIWRPPGSTLLAASRAPTRRSTTGTPRPATISMPSAGSVPEAKCDV